MELCNEVLVYLIANTITKHSSKDYLNINYSHYMFFYYFDNCMNMHNSCKYDNKYDNKAFK